jgi:hypothetical protein
MIEAGRKGRLNEPHFSFRLGSRQETERGGRQLYAEGRKRTARVR